MKLWFHKKNPYVHKVKPPKQPERDPKGYIMFLKNKQKTIEKYLKDEG